MTTNGKNIKSLVNYNGNNYLLPFILVTSLFFLWGFAHSLLDILNKHFQEVLHISKAESGLVQFALYGGYLVMAVPAGLIMNKLGYKRGIIIGLLLYATGAFLFYPAAYIHTFIFFLFCLFVIACGLTCLETAANPYTTILGPPNSAAQRINFSQSFNGLGWIIGPLVGGLIVFGNHSENSEKISIYLSIPYLVIGSLVLLVAIFFMRTPMPEIKEELLNNSDNKDVAGQKNLFQYRHFVLAIVAQFFYVAAQTGVNSFFINYVTESIIGISNQQAALILSFGGMGMFLIGRLTGVYILRFFKPNRLLAFYAFINCLLMIIVMVGLGWVSIVALFMTYFFMSIMFPTIFALGIRDLGNQTKKASSFIVMSIAGGALCPIIMGYIADVYGSMTLSFMIPFICFAVILYYGISGYRIADVK